MKHVICPICGSVCVKNGKTNAGTQRWLCESIKENLASCQAPTAPVPCFFSGEAIYDEPAKNG